MEMKSGAVRCFNTSDQVTWHIRGMEGSSKPDNVPFGLRGTSAMSGPLLLGSLEKRYSQTDSFLTAARLVRRGWADDGEKTGWQFSYLDCSARQPTVSRSDGNQGPSRAEICLKDPSSRQVPVLSSKTMAEEERETDSNKKADEAKQTEDAFLADRKTEGQTGHCSQAVIRVWATGCRTTCRQSRRFKAPVLPVIAEM